jgi:outer membrane protein, multidrug efflux system
MTTPRRRLSGFSALATCLMVSGCVPVMEGLAPAAKIAAAWHAPLPHGGRTADLVSWWATFGDPSLTALIGYAEAESPSLQSAAADIDKARATLASSQASLLPSLDGSGSLSRSGSAGEDSNRVAASTTKSGGLDASWELDLFGKARQERDAARTRVSEQVANWHDARVSLAAEVADYYVQYRACRQIETAYAVELASQRQTIRATEIAAGSGLTSSADLALARASAASSSSTLIAQKAECEVLVKSLAQVTGGDEPRVRKALNTGKSTLPKPKAFALNAVPADALRQRPDIAAFEAEVAASLADLGAAKADLYPSFSLSGTLTVSSSSLTGTSAPWSFGPALSIPLFDGGTRRAAVKSAQADYDVAVADYRSGVLDAVSEIETALVRVDSTQRQITDAAIAARNYRSYFNSIDTNWSAGGASLLDREDARRSAQSAEISLIETQRDAIRYWIQLYKALGGGWSPATASAVSPSDHSKGHRS